MIRHQISRLTGGLTVGASLLPLVALAQPRGSTTQRVTDKTVENLGLRLFGDGRQGDLFDLIANVIDAVLLIAGIVVLAYLIYGGFKYITAGGNADQAGEGRTAITNAIIGIIIIVAALAILSFVRGQLLPGQR